MGFHDRRYDDGEREGGFRGALRRNLSFAGFFSWSLPLFTVPRGFPGLGGIRVRVHIMYILVVGQELLFASLREGDQLRYVTARTATLFVLVLLHEFGHCLACRKVGGDADEVLMWPLGGLASCSPPMRWRPAFVTTFGGPAVNVALIPMLGGALLLAGADWHVLVFNPLSPYSVVEGPFFLSSRWHLWLWSAYLMNLTLLLFNLLVPMYPMDGARMVQELLWARLGYKRSMLIATTVGLVTAVALGLFGLVTSNLWMFWLALFGASVCYGERQRVRAMMQDEEPEWMYDTSKGFQAFEDGAKSKGPTRAQRRAAKTAAKEQAKAQEAQAALDAVLEKIGVHGISSLTARERAVLEQATNKRRSP